MLAPDPTDGKQKSIVKEKKKNCGLGFALSVFPLCFSAMFSTVLFSL